MYAVCMVCVYNCTLFVWYVFINVRYIEWYLFINVRYLCGIIMCINVRYIVWYYKVWYSAPS